MNIASMNNLGNTNSAFISETSNPLSESQPLDGAFNVRQAPIRLEAEDLDLTGYRIETYDELDFISGNSLISLKGSDGFSGQATGTFEGVEGTYDIKIGYYDEDDGQATLNVTVNGDEQSFRLTEDLNGNQATAQTITDRVTHQAIELQQGDSFSLEGIAHSSEFARIDYIEFIAVEDSDPADPNTSDNIEPPTAEDDIEPAADPIPEPDPPPAPELEPPTTPTFDPRYPVIEELATAGVEGGIPRNLSVVDTLNPGDDIEAAIQDANSQGGGVIVLNNGTYQVDSAINFEDNVVLRGQSRDGVVIQSNLRGTKQSRPKLEAATFRFEDDENAGIENLTIDFHVPNLDPVEREGLDSGRRYNGVFENNPGGRNDLYVRHVFISEDSQNNWIDGVSLHDAGTNPILVAGSHNTLSNNLVDGSYNKGGGGNGYYSINGNYNLIKNETVRNIRHFAIQQGAEHNVVIDSHFETNIDFHQGDNGNNLVESNTIIRPSWSFPELIDTGGSRHRAPGEGNIIFNNTTIDYRDGGSPFSTPGVIYTVRGKKNVVETDWEAPQGGTFYVGNG